MGFVSTITVSETVITKIQIVQNSFIRLALRLPKNVSARLLHEASGLPYVRERLISVGQNHLARMHANPLVEHTINSAMTLPNIWSPILRESKAMKTTTKTTTSSN